MSENVENKTLNAGHEIPWAVVLFLDFSLSGPMQSTRLFSCRQRPGVVVGLGQQIKTVGCYQKEITFRSPAGHTNHRIKKRGRRTRTRRCRDAVLHPSFLFSLSHISSFICNSVRKSSSRSEGGGGRRRRRREGPSLVVVAAAHGIWALGRSSNNNSSHYYPVMLNVVRDLLISHCSGQEKKKARCTVVLLIIIIPTPDLTATGLNRKEKRK